MVLPEGMLKAIAQWADVHPAYLTDPTDVATADRTDAQIELREVMKAVGASSIQFRALGEMSPDALRAIASSLRARASTPS
jgi:heterodisulfide reductase subunit B